MNKRQKRILGHTIGYTATLGVTLGIVLPLTMTGSSSSIGGTQKVTFMSNVPQFLDKGFNEATYEGAKRYAGNTNQPLGTRGSDFSDDGSTYIPVIESLYRAGAETLVSSGFSVAAAALDVLGSEEFKDKKFVIIDSTDLSNANLVGPTVSINYDASEAGFFAGLAAAVYADSIGKQKVGVWGGLDYPTVFDWMSGFEQAVNYYNYILRGTDISAGQAADPDDIQIIAGTTNPNETGIDYTGKASQGGPSVDPSDFGVNSWYTGGFTADGPEATAAGDKATNMISRDVAVMFPVAGPQTQIALNLAVEHGGTPNVDAIQIIGVDVDATNTATTPQKPHILGSSLKDVQKGTEVGLWYVDVFLNDYAVINQDNTVDWNMAEVEKKAKTENDIYYDAYGEDFITPYDPATNPEGWFRSDATPAQGDKAGRNSVFTGTYQNGAIGFTDGSQPQLELAFDVVENEINTALGESFQTFTEFTDYAYNENTLGGAQIENASWTFMDVITSIGVTFVPRTTPGAFPWIPNWTTYDRS